MGEDYSYAHTRHQNKVLQKELAARNLDDVSTEKLFRLESVLRSEIETLRNSTSRRQHSWSSIPGPEIPYWYWLLQYFRGELSPQAPSPDQTQNEKVKEEQPLETPHHPPAGQPET